jgi:uncharacterized protein YjbJ (UPF0337 family)
MNKDQVEGKVKDVAGRVERQVGEWTNDPEKQVNGSLKQAEGKVQSAWGNAKESVKKVSDNDADTAEVEETNQGDEAVRRKAS